MKLEDRIVERVSELLVDRLLADEFGKPNTNPQVDRDGDFHCPDHPDKIFVTAKAYRWHRSRVHKEKGGPPPARSAEVRP